MNIREILNSYLRINFEEIINLKTKIHKRFNVLSFKGKTVKVIN